LKILSIVGQVEETGVVVMAGVILVHMEMPRRREEEEEGGES